jgi:hypothetical protein
MHKERFLRHRKSKLMLRGDGLFRILEGVNAYKVDLKGEYNVSAIFKVYNLSLFDVGDDSMLNYLMDDVIMAMT